MSRLAAIFNRKPGECRGGYVAKMTAFSVIANKQKKA
jgi:hypothetical protein